VLTVSRLSLVTEIVVALGVAAGYFGLCGLGLSLDVTAGVSSVWPASGLLTGLLLVVPRDRWRAIVCGALLGGVAANLAFGFSAIVSVGYTLINLFESCAAALLVRRITPDAIRLRHPADVLSLTITVLGSAVSPLTRAGARAGDVLYVTGLLGGSATALQALLSGASPRAEHRERFASPRPRLDEARWLAERGASAAIDISDGLLADAGHLAAASGVAIELDPARYPCVSGVSAAVASWSGEEYELLVAFPPNYIPDFATFRERFGLPLTAIGRVTSGEGVRERGSAVRVEFQKGHDHFS